MQAAVSGKYFLEKGLTKFNSTDYGLYSRSRKSLRKV